jgi:two-component system NarL family sensor kinase
LRTAAAGTRRSLQGLRSLLVDIYPANLKTQGLDDAIADLLAPATSLGITTECAVRSDIEASIESTALIYRVVRESVRNVLRHADASSLSVTVDGDAEWLLASVVDDGHGFDSPGAGYDGSSNGNGHLGLRLISDLAADAGAKLSVESTVGMGTTVLLEVPR